MALVPKLRLGTQARKLRFLVGVAVANDIAEQEAELPQTRPQAELGNEWGIHMIEFPLIR